MALAALEKLRRDRAWSRFPGIEAVLVRASLTLGGSGELGGSRELGGSAELGGSETLELAARLRATLGRA